MRRSYVSRIAFGPCAGRSYHLCAALGSGPFTPLMALFRGGVDNKQPALFRMDFDRLASPRECGLRRLLHYALERK